MPPREDSGPRLEIQKHAAAEERLRLAFVAGADYEGKDADLALVRRKAKERGAQGVRRILGGG